ncbi:MAG: CDP-glycerol glycerophosphotransferase family protein [Eubacterium sp.]|nr:CDP-glycerol glycerophosphotransferase family protein [Eubacterium sp.]
MFDCKMVINRLSIEENKLRISVAFSCEYNADVTSPKAKVFFQQGETTRRLPLLMTNYFRQKQRESCVVVCNYTYLIDKLFFNKDSDEDIKIRIDFYYGENEITGVPFSISSNVILDNPDIEVSEENIEYECFDGVAVFDSASEYETSNEKYFDKYKFDFDFKENLIILKKTDKARKRRKFKPVSTLIKFILFVLRVLLAVALAPYFVIDGFFAALGIVPRRATKQIDTLSKNIFVQIKINFSSFLKTSFKKSNVVENLRKPVLALFRYYYRVLCDHHEIVPNRIAFMSGRRDEMGGNPEFVYNLIKDREDIDFKFLLFSDPNGHSKLKNIRRFMHLYATSKVVIVDDYFRLLNAVDKREGVNLFQLWHACGAFKTFGFTRLGKKGGPKQNDVNHRMYDCAIVSSQEIAKHYAEGFGLSDECIAATGIPRTDIFMDEHYAKSIQERFYEKRPQLRDKKIILFAPTFRGNGQMSAYYPLEAFDPATLYESLSEEYAILIKLHPFCQERYVIDEKYKDYIIDLSEEDELNDLLFVTDLLITDYSSVIFEASLRGIPMLFYAYDLYEYISSRDFYYDFESFVPGKIVFSQSDLIKSIKENDFDTEKVDGFKNKFFDSLDGKSSQRVADLIVDKLDI